MFAASRLRVRSGAVRIACAALIALLSTSSGAFAQCVYGYNFGGISNNGNLVPSASPLIANYQHGQHGLSYEHHVVRERAEWSAGWSVERRHLDT